MKKILSAFVIIVVCLELCAMHLDVQAKENAIPKPTTNLVSLYNQVAAIKSNGTVAVTKNTYFEFDNTPEILKWKDIVELASHSTSTLLMGLKKDGTVVISGKNAPDVSSWKGIVDITAGYDAFLGLKSDGTVLSVGIDRSDVSKEISTWKNIKKVITSEDLFVGIDVAGKIHSAGCSEDSLKDYRKAFSIWTDIVDVVKIGPVVAGLRKDGTIVTVGEETDSYYIDRSKFTDWKNIVQLVSGNNHVVGLKADGSVVGVGTKEFRNYGQYKVSGWKNIRQIAAGEYYTVGLKNDGTLVFTGENSDGVGNIKGWKGLRVPDKILLSKAAPLSLPQLSVHVEGKALAGTAKPYYGENNEIMVPAKAFAEAVGATLTQGKDKEYIITNKNKKVKFTIGKSIFRINDLYVEMKPLPIIKNGVVYAPISSLCPGLDCDYTYDIATKKVSVQTIKRKDISYKLVGTSAFTGKTEKVGTFICPDSDLIVINNSNKQIADITFYVDLLSIDDAGVTINNLGNCLVQKLDPAVVKQIINYIMPKVTAYFDNNDRRYELKAAVIYDKKSGRMISIESNYTEIVIEYYSESHTKSAKKYYGITSK